MSEEQPKNPYEGLTQDEIDRYEAYIASHPEVVIPLESRRNPEKEIAEFLALVATFERAYNLKELYSISELTPADAPNHPFREPARKDLCPIVTVLDVLKKETKIADERLEELKAVYKKLSRAVGIINNGIVDHTR